MPKQFVSTEKRQKKKERYEPGPFKYEDHWNNDEHLQRYRHEIDELER